MDYDHIEPSNLRDACSRAILKMILAPINTKYGKKITIVWPIESKSLGIPHGAIEALDFTRAYLLLKPREPKGFPCLKDADIILDFIGDNLRLNILREIKNNRGYYRHRFDFREIPIANPNIHIEAIDFITEIIEKAIACDEST